MPGLRVTAITAKTAPIGDPFPQIEALLGQAGFAGGMISRMANYPAQRPTSYRRTGTLGRNWRMTALGRRGADVYSEVTNNTEYAVHVQGPPTGEKGRRQTAVMADKGWPNIQRAARDEWAIWRPRVVRIIVTDARRQRL